jgi:hypothetical protein
LLRCSANKKAQPPIPKVDLIPELQRQIPHR